MKKVYIFFNASLLLINISCAQSEKIDPLSKIIVTSQRATCIKDSLKSKTFIFNYFDDVTVTFSDQSTIKSDELEIEIDSTKLNKDLDSNKTNTVQINNKNTKNSLSQFKKITFKKNVKVNKENKKIEADFAELFLPQKICNLFGNVKIEQTKKHIKDLPLNTFCNQATLNMETEKITLIGDEQKPVNTIIELGKHPGFLKKVKTKEEKRAEKKSLRPSRRR